jgi:hypothetical protein
MTAASVAWRSLLATLDRQSWSCETEIDAFRQFRGRPSGLSLPHDPAAWSGSQIGKQL